ncbi:PREDICTED: atherin-like [Chrysochloris asiatica]|uniref:Atherin-like n=1 Tax=Chrysochloris asiatica TaxID=185453 RepID=A0A9B0UD07_CHRAS|nr:PREDICTED: atherin-like [Chrysochloris asiatica]
MYALSALGEGSGRAPVRSSRPTGPGQQPGRSARKLGREPRAETGRARGAGGREVAAQTSCPFRPDQVGKKSFLDESRRVLVQRRSGFRGSDGWRHGARSRGADGERTGSREHGAPQLSAGTAGPAPATPPPPLWIEPLPAASAADTAVRGTPWARGGARFGQEFPPSARPPASLSRPPPPLPCPSRTRAARGGRRGRAAAQGGGNEELGAEDRPRREARSSCSCEPPPSFPPCKRGDGGSS